MNPNPTAQEVIEGTPWSTRRRMITAVNLARREEREKTARELEDMLYGNLELDESQVIHLIGTWIKENKSV